MTSQTIFILTILLYSCGVINFSKKFILVLIFTKYVLKWKMVGALGKFSLGKLHWE